MSEVSNLLNPSVIGFVWQIVKWFLIAILAALLLGLIVGVATYGRPRRNRRSEGVLDDALEIGVLFSHRLVDRLLGKRSATSETWMNNQQVLFMLQRMSPSAFEEYMARVFTALGYETEVVGGANDGGIDIDMRKDGRHSVVQCKKFITRKVRPHDVRDFYGAMGARHIDGKGFFVTTNIFTFEAEQFAEGKPMELIDGTRLVELVRKSGVVAMNPVEVQNTRCPNCGGVLVLRKNQKNNERFYGCSNYPRCRFTRPNSD